MKEIGGFAMKRGSWFVVVLGTVMLGVLLLPEFAFGANAGVNVGNPANIALTLSAATINFGNATPGSPTTLSAATSTSVTSSANNWSLTVQASNDLADGAGAIIPIGRMSIKQSTAGTWTSLSITAQTLLAAMPKNNPAGQSFDWDFQINVDPADPTSANPFSTQLTFTAF